VPSSIYGFFPSTVVALYDVVLAKRACSVDVKPFINAGTVIMVAAREFPQFHPVVISREADATFLHMETRLRFRTKNIDHMMQLLRKGKEKKEPKGSKFFGGITPHLFLKSQHTKQEFFTTKKKKLKKEAFCHMLVCIKVLTLGQN